MKEKRLKRGEYIAMSPEEKILHNRLLQRRWRHKHPDWVKASNKKWSEIYKETEPFKCVCKKCGGDFYKSRNSYKICPDCLAKIHAHNQSIRDAKIAKRRNKQKRTKEIIQMFFGIGQQEMTLEEIGDKFGLTRERVRQIKEKAIRRLRQSNRSKLLKSYLG